MNGSPLGVFACCLLLSIPVALAAQERPVAAHGDRVRVKAPDFSSKRLTGTLVERTAATWTLQLQGTDSVVPIPVEAIEKADVSVGKKSWAIRGAVMGLVAANIWVYAIGDYVGDEDLRALAATILGIPAAGLGALVGSNFHHDRWKATSLPAPGMGPPGPPGRIRIGVTLPVRLP